MQKNYIILVHKNPEQLKHLVEKLDDGQSDFYLHIDKNTDSKPFLEILSGQSNIHFVKKREEGTWGDLGIVKATINSMKEATANTSDGYCILLSGQDYPIKNTEEINAYLNQNEGLEFIDICSLDTIINTKEWKRKLTHYKYNLSSKRGHYILLAPFFSASFFTTTTIKNIAKIITCKKGLSQLPLVFSNLFKTRKVPKNIIPFAGGQWWALTNNSSRKIIAFLDRNPDYLEYHRYTLLPDEIFFQSILMRLVSHSDNEIIFGNSLTYINWSRKNCDLPVTFIDSDIDELTSQPENLLFARKFDFGIDKKIFYRLDALKNTDKNN